MASTRFEDPEWQARVDLAACYRLMAHYRMTDLVYTHISGAIPGRRGRFLVNPFGLLFHEITPSNLVPVDLAGNALGDDDPEINIAGFFIHSAIHEARPDLGCVIHAHTQATVAVAAQRDGLLPISQHAARFHGRLAYHDYTGVANDDAERRRLAADLGPHDVMILRNHGVLVGGRTAAEAFVAMHYLERACQAQIAAQSGGAALLHMSPGLAELTAQGFERNRQRREVDGKPFLREWAALLRQLDQVDPHWRG